MSLAAFNFDQHILDAGPPSDDPLELCDACDAGDHQHCESPVRCDCPCGDRVRADVLLHYSYSERRTSPMEAETGYVDEYNYCPLCPGGRCQWEQYFPEEGRR